jgi:hypothetical protein
MPTFVEIVFPETRARPDHRSGCFRGARFGAGDDGKAGFLWIILT